MTWPDGHETKGIDVHIADLKARMDHEWLFWDNQDFYKQIGLGK